MRRVWRRDGDREGNVGGVGGGGDLEAAAKVNKGRRREMYTGLTGNVGRPAGAERKSGSKPPVRDDA